MSIVTSIVFCASCADDPEDGPEFLEQINGWLAERAPRCRLRPAADEYGGDTHP